jgi:adenosylcobinamide-phosphate synthase
MSAFASLLGIRLGGGASYQKTWTPKPWIGAGRETLMPDDLGAALRLYRKFRLVLLFLSGVWLVIGLSVRFLGGEG